MATQVLIPTCALGLPGQNATSGCCEALEVSSQSSGGRKSQPKASVESESPFWRLPGRIHPSPAGCCQCSVLGKLGMPHSDLAIIFTASSLL